MVLEKLQARVKEIDQKVKAWVKEQPLPIEVALVTLGSGLQGGVIGALMGSFTSDLATNVPPPPGQALTPEAESAMKQMQAISGGPWLQARNFAVMTGVNAGISCAVRRIRNIQTDDLQTSVIAAFGSGMAFSLISGVGGGAGPGAPHPAVQMVTTGICFALFQGGFFQVGKLVSGNASGQEKDALDYEQTASMLTRLGLQKYKKNFRKGMLNDRTLPLLNDSALQEVRIPPGPRLLILDYIKKAPSDDWTDDAVPGET